MATFSSSEGCMELWHVFLCIGLFLPRHTLSKIKPICYPVRHLEISNLVANEKGSGLLRTCAKEAPWTCRPWIDKPSWVDKPSDPLPINFLCSYWRWIQEHSE